MKNIVFDLGGVLFARDKSKCTPELLEFFSFLRAPRRDRRGGSGHRYRRGGGAEILSLLLGGIQTTGR